MSQKAARMLDGELVLVTGSTSGLGKQICHTCAGHGARVVVTGRDQARGEAVVRDIEAKGGVAYFVVGDLSKEDAPHAMVEEIKRIAGPVTVLVNNAVSHEAIDADGSVVDVERSTFLHLLTVGLVASAMLAKEVIPGMIERGKGCILNITASSAHVGIQGQSAYASTKGGMTALSRQICADFGRQGVRANTVEPGYIIHEKRDATMTEERRAYLAGRRIARFATAEDIAEAVAFLASKPAEVIVGVTLPIDGGATAVRAHSI
jgi:NAD(P)-dependent dehydrogenase (short-subunit alcohol dehydrogenase family)